MFRIRVDDTWEYYLFLFALQRPFHVRFVRAHKLPRSTPNTITHASVQAEDIDDLNKDLHLYNYLLDTEEYPDGWKIGNFPIQNIWVQPDIRLKQGKKAYTDMPFDSLWHNLKLAGTKNTNETADIDTEEEWRNMDKVIKKYGWVQELIDSGKDKGSSRRRKGFADEPDEDDKKRDELVQISEYKLAWLACTIEEFVEYGKEATREIGTTDFRVKPLYGDWTLEHVGTLCDGIQGRCTHVLAKEFADMCGLQYTMSFYMSRYGLQEHCTMLSMLWCYRTTPGQSSTGPRLLTIRHHFQCAKISFKSFDVCKHMSCVSFSAH